MQETDILKIVPTLISRGTPLHTLYDEMEQMYFMDKGTPQARILERPMQDPNDVKLTLSPSARNAIIGLVRLLTTNEPRFTAKSKIGSQKLHEIEELARIMWSESCEQKNAEIHVDLVRSGALYADVHLAADYVEDLVAVADDYEKRRLGKIGKRTPVLFEARSPVEDYLYWGRYGMRGVLRRWKATGDDVRSTFNQKELQLGDSTEVTVLDWMDTTHRRVWIEGKDNQALIPYQAHDLDEILFAAQVADGSDLWRDEKRRRQPFLYAMSEGNLWRRENQWLTELFTAMNERGTGPLMGFDQEPGDVKVLFAGPGVRYITAPQPRMLSDSAFDSQMLAVKSQVLQPLVESSTIFPQTLGSPSEMGRAPFSSIAMLAQSGQLPVVPIKRAVANAIASLLLAVFRRLKADPPEEKLPVELSPSDIPDDLEIEVSLEIKLPQDMFKNVQAASVALDKTLASREWVQENLLQINDSDDMLRRIWKEQAGELAFKSLMEQFIRQITAPPAPAAGPGATPAMPAGPGPAGTPEMLAGGPQVTPGGGAIEASQPQAPAGAEMPPMMPPEEMPA